MTFRHHKATIYKNVTIEEDVYIGPGCVIGYPAEHKLFRDKPQKGVVIKKGSYLSAGVKIQAGTERDTVIGENCYIMTGAYIAHDCNIQNDVTISAGVKLAGHCSVQDRVNLGMGVSVHQYSAIPEGCMIGMNSTITKQSKLESNNVYIGSPIRYLRKNN